MRRSTPLDTKSTVLRSALAALVTLAVAGVAEARVETLRWMSGDNAGRAAIAGYKLHAGDAPGVYQVTIDLGLPSPSNGVFTVSRDINLPDDVTIYLAMSAYSNTLDANNVPLESALSSPQTRSGQAPAGNGAPVGIIQSPSTEVATIQLGGSLDFASFGFDPDGDTISFDWDFDALISGVAPSSAEDPGTVVFDRPGTFTVSLTVTDSQGLSNTLPDTLTVNVTMPGGGGPQPGPVASARRVGRGLSSPVAIAAPVGDTRVFVAQRDGRIRVLEGGGMRSQSFLDLRSDTSTAGSGGLLGLAFDPEYDTNGFVFTYRTDAAGNSVVSRFTVFPNDPYTLDPASELEILHVTQPQPGNAGGGLAFDAAGFLMLSLGDGGGVGDPAERAQDGQSLLGKVLRLDVAVPPMGNSQPSGNGAYSIPADNPFLGDGSVRDEIWAIGLHDPRDISIDRQTGDLWIADPGQSLTQEINFETGNDAGGHNYGWDVMEGSVCNPTDPAGSPACDAPELTAPIFEYPTTGNECEIVGGHVYRGAHPQLRGEYFFADACSGKLWSLDPQSGAVTSHSAQLASSAGRSVHAVAIGEGGTGELFVIADDGYVYKLGMGLPECSDGVDNDGDGMTDHPQDSGCADTDGLFETPLCQDGFDNDGDGAVDLEDPECRTAWQNVEADALPANILVEEPFCGLGAELVLIFPPLIWLRQRRRMASARS
jgi:glucose/arabinose dehydrogenase